MSAKDFLVEIGCGELPPKALKTLSAAFASGIEKGLQDAGLVYTAIAEFAAPRRLAVRVSSLATAQQDAAQEKFGPAVSAAYDKEGNPTWSLLRAAGQAKDNRIFPPGAYLDDDPRTAAVGVIDDPSFKAGEDTVRY